MAGGNKIPLGRDFLVVSVSASVCAQHSRDKKSKEQLMYLYRAKQKFIRVISYQSLVGGKIKNYRHTGKGRYPLCSTNFIICAMKH